MKATKAAILKRFTHITVVYLVLGSIIILNWYKYFGIILFSFEVISSELILMHLQASQQVAKPFYDTKVTPSTLIPKQIGNMYTASLYAAFASLIHNKNSSLVISKLLCCVWYYFFAENAQNFTICSKFHNFPLLVMFDCIILMELISRVLVALT